MGITLESKNKSIDLGYGGFMSLRTKVAELAADDIGKHYRKLSTAPSSIFEAEHKEFFKEYDKKIVELDEKYKGEMNCILHFLYASDCEAEMELDVCEKLYEVIKDYDDDIAYGYYGRKDCATFKDFKNIVKDCIDNKCTMKWW